MTALMFVPMFALLLALTLVLTFMSVMMFLTMFALMLVLTFMLVMMFLFVSIAMTTSMMESAASETHTHKYCEDETKVFYGDSSQRRFKRDGKTQK